ncbi:MULTISPECIES: hypothetical protein [unclassified Leuconostoc]|uniref:hypothetical protein n=1 Tax=unclassified Leuconostoc TaxID=2685106 RepID=UPI001904A6D6|nr:MULTISPECIES: hypothetical protein [unclassified Leuconostoc]MBK0040768.1 hypothetical protein [Leuconostoc sp. S51]MBK0051810.1 hypothetical protein [Leuconostoc sp. S50]
MMDTFSDDQKVSFFSKLIFEIIFLFVSVIYVVGLHRLNNAIKFARIKPTEYFKIVQFNQYSSFKYTLGALLLLIIVISLGVWYFAAASENEFTRWFVLLFIGSLVINILVLIIIWNLINVPVLRAILIVGGIGAGVIVGLLSNNR